MKKTIIEKRSIKKRTLKKPKNEKTGSDMEKMVKNYFEKPKLVKDYTDDWCFQWVYCLYSLISVLTMMCGCF